MKPEVAQHSAREWVSDLDARRRATGRCCVAAVLLLGACASEAPPPAKHASHSATAKAEPATAAPSPEAVQAEQRKRAEARAVELATSVGLTAADLQWSPQRTAFVLVAPARAEDAATAPAKLIVGSGATGRKEVELAALRPGPVSELRFLDERRLVYLAAPAAPGQTPAAKAKTTGKGAKAAAKTITWVIQSIMPGAGPVACEGTRFVWSEKRDHLAWIGGEPGAEYVGADGQKAYPRSGVTTIKGDPAWSRDGHSLAFVEMPGTGKPGAAKAARGGQPKLIVLVEVDNPTGDLSWELPANIDRGAMRVFWAGAGSVVVGESLTKPAYSSSFVRE